ncbi:MAG: hypothetical protein RDV41_00350 [Planctomycetota bacterium]|nr:hypothetical protein [Planctomycetota bacterium]
MRSLLASLAVLSVALLFVPQATADILHLDGGGKVEGVVTDKGTHYEVLTTTGTSTIQKGQVLMIERKESVIEKYRTAAAEVKKDDAEGHFGLAMICKEGKWASKMREELQKVIEINPDHEGARKELGFEKYEGKWMTHDEVMAAKGFLKLEGQWVTQAYIDKVDAWRLKIQKIGQNEDKMNKILRRMASSSVKTREKATGEFAIVAKEAGITNNEEVANEIKDYYDDAWQAVLEAESQRVVSEMRVADARIIQMRQMDIAAGTEPFPVIMQLPQLSIMSAKTTVIIPVRIKLYRPPRPVFAGE